MNKYIELEKRLADLTLTSELHYVWQDGPELFLCIGGCTIQPIPQWTREWNACGPLMAEHGVNPTFYIDKVMADYRDLMLEPVIEKFEDHPDKDTAAMCAIVKAVINKLEEESKK